MLGEVNIRRPVNHVSGLARKRVKAGHVGDVVGIVRVFFIRITTVGGGGGRR